ncbi:hypothetical protein, partial [Methylophaga thiooxydans]|uniref:hypothetical protein n=1 Tax=Methylophaga thiooxydans TaxID=392484 RepID=UPI00235220F9
MEEATSTYLFCCSRCLSPLFDVGQSRYSGAGDLYFLAHGAFGSEAHLPVSSKKVGVSGYFFANSIQQAS